MAPSAGHHLGRDGRGDDHVSGPAPDRGFRLRLTGGSPSWQRATKRSRKPGCGSIQKQRRGKGAPTTLIKTACTRDCPDSCGLLVRRRDGLLAEHRGDPDHGFTRGFLCRKGRAFLRRHYSPDRLLHPLRKAPGGWRRIDWDEALDLAAERLAHYRDACGAASVLSLRYNGSLGILKKVCHLAFWEAFGPVTVTRGGMSGEAGSHAQRLDFGAQHAHDPEDLRHSRSIVIWGRNPTVTNVHLVPRLREAQRRGARLVVVDPIYTATARLADRWLSVLPGGDGALAAGACKVLLERGLYNGAFAEGHTEGFDAFRARVEALSWREIERWSGLGRAACEELAELYAAPPVATWLGIGPQYYRQGVDNYRLIDALAAISGNLGIPGGGASQNIDGWAHLDYSLLRRRAGSASGTALGSGAAAPPRRRLSLPRLGEELSRRDLDPAVRMAWVSCANPVSSAPDSRAVARGLASLDFLVVVDQFLTETAELADLVLPATTYLEEDDLVASYGHNWLSLVNRAAPPRGEAKSDQEIYALLADRLGLDLGLPPVAGPAAPPAGVQELRNLVLSRLAPLGLGPAELANGPRRNPAAPEVPFAGGAFATPTGKYRLVTEWDLAPAPSPPGYSLRLLGVKASNHFNSQLTEREGDEIPAVRLHPTTAAAHGLSPGELVLVRGQVGADTAGDATAVAPGALQRRPGAPESPPGAPEAPPEAVEARLELDDRLPPDVLHFPHTVWLDDRGGINRLRRAHVSRQGEVAAFHETWVQVDRKVSR